MAPLKDDLQAAGFELVETHVSQVFLGARDVYKVKRPVFLGFLDFRTLEQRHAACLAEVELNRRLAPEVYLGVVPVTLDASGSHRLGGDGPVVDWAVHMVRLDDANRADRLVRSRGLTPDDLEGLAQHLVSFHARARSDAHTAAFGSPERIAVNVRENFDQTRDSITRYLTRAEADEIERYQLEFLERHADRFEARRAQGRVRDGHGDLRLEHIYFAGEGPPTIIDCIEFNERFRYADVCADIAFLSMDLAWHGRTDLAEHFLAAYARAANDFDLYGVVDFYEGYRAYVRGKVASMLAADRTVGTGARWAAGREARRYYLLALAAKRRSLLPPVVLAVGGIIGSGKSTLAGQLARELTAPVVDTDHARKFLAGVAPDTPLPDPAWSGRYDDLTSERVYDEVFRRARVVLESGRPVVIDASFRTRAARDRARILASEAGVPFVFVECRAPIEVCRRRLEERARRPGVSDGRPEILDAFAARFEPVDELPPARHIVVDTTQPLDQNLETLRRSLAAWPEGLTG